MSNSYVPGTFSVLFNYPPTILWKVGSQHHSHFTEEKTGQVINGHFCAAQATSQSKCSLVLTLLSLFIFSFLSFLFLSIPFYFYFEDFGSAFVLQCHWDPMFAVDVISLSLNIWFPTLPHLINVIYTGPLGSTQRPRISWFLPVSPWLPIPGYLKAFLVQAPLLWVLSIAITISVTHHLLFSYYGTSFISWQSIVRISFSK